MKRVGPPSRLPLWREEVSFRTADERYVGRRQLGNFMVLTSLGMLCGNVWILVRSLWRRAPRHPEQVVGRADDLAVGGARVFEYAGEPRLLVRLEEDRYAAYSQKCTHLSCAVHYERETGRLACPCHIGYFSAATGAVLQGPPPRPLPRVLLEQRGAELVAVGVEGEVEA